MRLSIVACILLGLATQAPPNVTGDIYVFPPASEGEIKAPESPATAPEPAKPAGETEETAPAPAPLPVTAGKLELQAVWSPGGDRELRCTATLDAEYEEKTLACAELHEVDGGELLGPTVLEFRDTDWPIAMVPLAEVGGRLLTVWSGGGSYRVRVFAWQNDRVQKVLEESCLFFPEVIYDRSGNELLLLSTPAGKPGPGRQHGPGETRIFRWQENAYLAKTVPWGKRLETLRGMLK